MAGSRARILIVDDNAELRLSLLETLDQAGYEVLSAGNGAIAERMVNVEHFDVVITDIIMPGLDGARLLAHIKGRCPNTAVIMMTGRSSLRECVALLRKGAYDYLRKPVRGDEALRILDELLRYHRRDRGPVVTNLPGAQNAALGDNQGMGSMPRLHPVSLVSGELHICHPSVIGRSEAILYLLAMVDKAAQSECTVLVQGEAGTGKELIARAIHQGSSRRDGPFMPIECSAIPRSALEGELFGYVGAIAQPSLQKQGVLQQVGSGTLFLSEVSCIEMPVQLRLAHCIETRKFRPVGAPEDARSEARIVASTKADLRRMVEEGQFREELYYALQIFPIIVPPLRERRSDIPLLVAHFSEQFRRDGNEVGPFSSEAMEILCPYEWPGNVRELRSVVGYAGVLSRGHEVKPEHLPDHLGGRSFPTAASPSTSASTFQEGKNQFEVRYLTEILTQHAGQVAGAAAAAGISRAHFYELLKKHRIDPSRFSSG